MLDIHTTILFLPMVKLVDGSFLLIVLCCAGWMGAMAGKCNHVFYSLRCSSAWLYTHLGFCNLLTGLWNSHIGRLVHILLLSYSQVSYKSLFYKLEKINIGRTLNMVVAYRMSHFHFQSRMKEVMPGFWLSCLCLSLFSNGLTFNE